MNIDGNALFKYSEGLTIAIVSIIMVFVVLLLIIVLTDLVSKIASKEKKEVIKQEKAVTNNHLNKLDLNDDDAIVACLIAAIDYREKTGKHIEILSVRKV